MTVEQRQKIERAIVGAVVRGLAEAGFTFHVINGDNSGGSASRCVMTVGETETLAAMFATDCDRLYALSGLAPGGGKCIGYVEFIYGNTGWDVMHDWTENLEPHMAEAIRLSEQYADAMEVK